ncbi:hypothetical protein [Bacillus sp. KH172YL63]|uniref:hypothetical protein n=1 Tax=Bacillus sp. KH172YL63 TaxID=2709784 RepID=UPI0013E44FFC|nr:hypothetical protein [Bacillus sp. KH172YL63]BCB02671.1 hypothetical protein KH172YL63_08040 [Bacillus sp. KH172YL63]
MLAKTQYLLIIFIGVSAGLLGGIMQLPFWTIGVTIFVGILGIVILPLVWAVYLTKNTETVKRYLQSRKKHPYFDFY